MLPTLVSIVMSILLFIFYIIGFIFMILTSIALLQEEYDLTTTEQVQKAYNNLPKKDKAKITILCLGSWITIGGFMLYDGFKSIKVLLFSKEDK